MNNILQKEANFHDTWAGSINLDELLINETFTACTSPENKYILSKLGSLKGKRILDIGCGAGESSVYFALQGADVTALDVSEKMINTVIALAKKYNVTVKIMFSDVLEMENANETYDIVYGNGVLHHFQNHRKCLEKIYQVLARSGVAAFIEPLAHNPIINIYRKIATEVRTEDEKPFKISELEEMFTKQFDSFEHEEFWFFTTAIFLKFFLIDRVHPNKERYWKKIIKEVDKIEPLYGRLKKLDDMLLDSLLFLKRYCWNSVIIGKKH